MDLVQRADFITHICTGKKVLHLGCANYPYTVAALEEKMLLHSDLNEIASELHGFDYDREGLDILAEHGFTNLHQGDLEKLELLEIDETFDVILAGEIIEHLNNPGLFLQGVQRFMGQDSVLLLTTINAYCGMRFLYYGARGKRGIAEPVHPDHVAYYSYSTLKLLLERHNIEVVEFAFYDLGKEHRPHTPWFLKAVNDLCVRLAPQWADGILALCRVKKS